MIELFTGQNNNVSAMHPASLLFPCIYICTDFAGSRRSTFRKCCVSFDDDSLPSFIKSESEEVVNNPAGNNEGTAGEQEETLPFSAISCTHLDIMHLPKQQHTDGGSDNADSWT